MRKSLQMHSETGGITILVVLMLLVLMTVSALAMSKNALREVIISGTSRQGAEARNLADSGIEWSVYWMANDIDGQRPTPTGAAAVLTKKQDDIIAAKTPGVATPLGATAEMITSSDGTTTKKYDLNLTYMGEFLPDLTQKGAPSLKLWSVRSNANIAYVGGPTFIHSREAWFTTSTKLLK